MSETQHRHKWRDTTIDLPNGPKPGRRCACGVEVVGSAGIGINAEVIRAGQGIERALVDGLAEIARRLRSGQ